MMSVHNTSRPSVWHGPLVFALTMMVYVISMPRSLGLEDDGLFLMSAYFNGISHPPGYPLHSLLAHLFTLLPFGSIPFRVHLLSAVFAALACALLWQLVWRLTQAPMAAYVAAFVLAFSNVFWSQAIIAEVYTLNSFFIVLLMLLAQQAVDKAPQRKVYLLGFSLVYGLALTNHWPLVVVSSLGLALMLLPAWKELLRYTPWCLLLLVLGLSPYGWMYLHSQSDPFVAFYGPINGIGELWFYISRQGYAGMDNSVAAGMADKWGMLMFFARELLHQGGWLALVLAVVGVVAQFRYLGLRWALALLLVFACNSLLLIAMLGFEYDEFYSAVFRVYPITAYVIFALWIGLGALFVLRFLKQWLTAPTYQYLAPTMVVVVVMAVLLSSFNNNMRRDDVWAANYGKAVLSKLDPGAILFADDDVSFAVMAYLRYVEGFRPDIEIYNTSGFVLQHRLFRPFRMSKEEEHKLLLEFVMSSNKPIYMIDAEVPGFAFHDYLMYKRLRPTWSPQDSDVSLNTGVLSYLAQISMQRESTDAWARMHRSLLLSSALPKLMRYNLDGVEGESVEQVRIIISAALMTFAGQVERLGFMTKHPDMYTERELLEAVSEADSFYRDNAHNSLLARYWMYKGDLVQALKTDEARAQNFYQQAYQVWKHPENPVLERFDGVAP